MAAAEARRSEEKSLAQTEYKEYKPGAALGPATMEARRWYSDGCRVTQQTRLM